MSYETFTCPDHGIEVPRVSGREAREQGLGEGCARCVEELRGPLPQTPEERVSELLRLSESPLTTMFEILHERIERLVGRPVWTHELGSVGIERLCEEIRSGNTPTDLNAHALATLREVAKDKPLIAINPKTNQVWREQ